MAKAQQITDLNCRANASEEARKVLLTRIKEVTEFARMTIKNGEEVEVIHDLRVSIRRLRSTIRDFSEITDKKTIKLVRQQLKVLASALGAVRDRDVACEALEKLKAKAEEEKETKIASEIAKLIEQERQTRSQAYQAFSKYLEEKIVSFEKHFSATVVAAIKRSNLTFEQLGRSIVSRNLSDFLSLSKHLYEPFEIESLHKFRISSKRLRYSIELFAACYSRENAGFFATQIAKMQGALGDLHDCDVWIENLGKSLAENRIEKKTGMWLLSEFTKRRGQSYRKAIMLRAEWIESDFWLNLQELLC